jgi:hypothetical protein
VTDKNGAEGVAAPSSTNNKCVFALRTDTDHIPDDGRGARARERAARNVRKYIAWKADNGRAYKMLIAQATKRAEAGGVVSGDWLIGWLRSHDVVNDLGKPCRPNNDFSPLIIRDICRDCPQVGPNVETRTSVYDEFFKEGGEA